jgi:hypothetical protein
MFTRLERGKQAFFVGSSSSVLSKLICVFFFVFAVANTLSSKKPVLVPIPFVSLSLSLCLWPFHFLSIIVQFFLVFLAPTFFPFSLLPFSPLPLYLYDFSSLFVSSVLCAFVLRHPPLLSRLPLLCLRSPSLWYLYFYCVAEDATRLSFCLLVLSTFLFYSTCNITCYFLLFRSRFFTTNLASLHACQSWSSFSPPLPSF